MTGYSTNQEDGKLSPTAQVAYMLNPDSILLVFGILLMVVDISVVVACAPKTGYLLVPMASSVKLWHAMKAELWRSEFDLCYDERTVYGLSESGELTQLRQNEVGIQSSPAEWDEWVAEVGEIGTLVMIAGSLV
jgi:hypothetical protein